MFKTQQHKIHSPFFIAFWLLIALIIQPVALAQEGTVKTGEIHSPALEGNLIGDPATRPFAIYLPPSYETSDKRYPVIYVLHGYTQGVGALTNIRWTLDAMIQSRDIGELIAVFVDGFNKFRGCWYRSSKTIGDYETYIARDLVNHIDANYRTIAHRDSRGITGYSMGGAGSMHLALKFPEVFSVVVSQVGTCSFDTDKWKQRAKNAALADPKDWNEFYRLDFQIQAPFAIAAAATPNSNKPPFFLDMPAEVVNGEAQIIPEVWQKIVDYDVMHDLERYLKQPVRLNGIKMVAGKTDWIVPIDDVRPCDKFMTDLGVDHVFEEHGGGHDFIADKSLKFLSDRLKGIELLDKTFAIEAKGKLTTTWGKIKTGK